VHKKDMLLKHIDQNKVQLITFESLPYYEYDDFFISRYINFRIIIRLQKILTTHKIDLVHSNDIRMSRTWLFPCFLTKTKHIWHQRNKISFPDAVLSFLASKVITNSHFCSNSFPGYIKQNISVINNPIAMQRYDKNECKAKLLDELNLPANTIVIGWFANFIDRKQPESVIKIAAEYKNQFSTNIVFCMFGEPRRAIYDQVKLAIDKLMVGDIVKIMGFKKPIDPWMACCDIALATSVKEGHGRTLIEAMLINIPVVASSSGGHLEIIKNNSNGILVAPYDFKAYVSAIHKLTTDVTFKNQLTKNATLYAEENFSTQQHKTNVLTQYHQALKTT